MPISNLTAFKTALGAAEERSVFLKSAVTLVIGRCYSSWLSTGVPAAGVAPTTASVPTRATTGALGQVNPTGTRRIIDIVLAWGQGSGGLVTIADRLSHQGGLSGIVTGAVTTNLPTAALTRKTSGTGVIGGFEIYSAVGATASTITCSYTDDTATAGNASLAVTFGGTGFNAVSRFIPFGLADGDKGVRSVESVTLAGTTATAGNYGVTLMFPHVSLSVEALGNLRGPGNDWEASGLYGMGTWFPVIDTDACLQFLYHSTATSFGLSGGHILFAED